MEKKSNKGVVISLLIVIAVLIGSITYMFISGTVTFNINDNKNNNNTEEKEDNKNENDKENENDDEIDISISMDAVSVSKDAPNTKILITGMIDLSYDNNKYEGVTLSGYCLGADNEKYLINGPSDGRALFHNDGNKDLTLAENSDAEYPDGTTKDWSEIDWESIEIKYCKIDKMKAILSGGTTSREIELNVEKNFN